ncbi:sodium/hydrogen exchanger [Plakobranchus ocellatus]|uniref:Sodium/hydrogen exchanger n=1 Tax=Plakobranchus ocellatus TaxID=259542 RepID=A0AAV4DY14_9GAST|nr:sodium/hydrogen exchanger [Plakobranchus ocellatus]
MTSCRNTWPTISTIFLTLLASLFLLCAFPVLAQDSNTTDVSTTDDFMTTSGSFSPDTTQNNSIDSSTGAGEDGGGHEGSENGGGHEGGEEEEEEDEHESGPLEVATINYEEIKEPLIFTIVVLLAGASKIGYHHADFLSSKIPESCILIVLGTVFGAIIHFTGASDDLPHFFEPHEFFVYLLPPIILEAAYSLHDRTVLENIGSILLFAVLGTVLASVFIGLTLYGLAEIGAMGSLPEVNFIQLMIFSSLIVAVDPVAVLAVFNEIGVNHVLYFMVFGESLLNDGVTVVLYKVFQSYNVMDEINGVHILLGFIKFLVVCFGGLFLGILAGILTAIFTKYATHVKVAQPIIIYTMAYFGFLLAEMFEFSGIISIIGCGLTQVQYAFNNISDKSRTTVKYFTKVISTCNEIIIFLFLGLSIINDDHEWNTGFTIWTILLCLLFRFIIIFAMSAMINKYDFHRVRLISLYEQFMIAYGGLRGAVCFSLVALLSKNEVPAKSMFMTTTLVVILFTVFVQGITIKPLVYWLQIGLAPEKTRSMYQELSTHVTDHMMAGMEEIIGEHGRNHFREKLAHFDSKYLKPWLEVDPDPRDATLKVFYENLLLKEHYNYLKISGAKTPEHMPELPNISADMLVSSMMGGDMSATRPLLKHPDGEEFDDRLRMSLAGTPNIVISQDPDTEIAIRKRTSRSKSIIADNRQIDAAGLRSLLISQRDSKLILSKYDRNLTTHGGDVQTRIQRQKTVRNRRLQRLMSESGSGATSPARSPGQKRKSWGEIESEVATERSHHPQGPRHAATVDLGTGIGRIGTVDPISPGLLASQLDSVFEEDENAASTDKQDRNGKKSTIYEEKGEEQGKEAAPDEHDASKHHILKRQVGMDRPSPSPVSGRRDGGDGQDAQFPLSDITETKKSEAEKERDSKV